MEGQAHNESKYHASKASCGKKLRFYDLQVLRWVNSYNRK